MEKQKVFPAHAGMSPSLRLLFLLSLGFPRTRGDEPISEITEAFYGEFSPHTRG